MKNIKINKNNRLLELNSKIFFLLICTITITSCKKNTDFYSMYSNISERDIYLYSSSFSLNNIFPIYPDTSLSTFFPDRIKSIRRGETLKYLNIISRDWTNDTISFFIIDADSISTYGWCLERIDEFILQRYDLSKEDYLTLFREKKSSMSFPPNDAMKNIKMWPPYGYYDSTGHHASK